MTGADQYAVWSTDSSGRYLSPATGVVSGAIYALQRSRASFQQDLNNDGRIGLNTLKMVAASSSGDGILAGSATGDAFVFPAHFGHGTIENFQPEIDQIEIDHTVFSTLADLFAHTTDDGHGNAVITVSADQSIVIEGISKAVLQQHNDFYLV